MKDPIERHHTASDRYWVDPKPDETGWIILYGPQAENVGECVAHVHQRIHADLICAAVNLHLETRERTERSH